MEIDVYDTFTSSKKGNTIHFDLLLPSVGKKDDASKYARVFLEKIGESSEALDSCKFCHSEKADVEVEKQIQSDGHYIVPIDGCHDNCCCIEIFLNFQQCRTQGSALFAEQPTPDRNILYI